MKEVANKTNEEAGDGTTTATILAKELFQSGMERVGHGASALSLR